jgi:hypothetical protein
MGCEAGKGGLTAKIHDQDLQEDIQGRRVARLAVFSLPNFGSPAPTTASR